MALVRTTILEKQAGSLTLGDAGTKMKGTECGVMKFPSQSLEGAVESGSITGRRGYHRGPAEETEAVTKQCSVNTSQCGGQSQQGGR